MSTHFAAVKDGIVVATRSSASRSLDCPVGHKFGPYTHAVLRTKRTVMLATEQANITHHVITWHGGTKNAAAGLRAANVGHSWTSNPSYRPVEEHYTETYLAAELVEVVVTPRKATVGQALATPTVADDDADDYRDRQLEAK